MCLIPISLHSLFYSVCPFSLWFKESERGGDPVPVVSRSIQRAKDEGFDVVIIDTSGRLSNNFELTQQLMVRH